MIFLMFRRFDLSAAKIPNKMSSCHRVNLPKHRPLHPDLSAAKIASSFAAANEYRRVSISVSSLLAIA